MIVLKTAFDQRTQQLVRTVKLDTGRKVRFFGEIDTNAQQMLALGNFSISVMVGRVQRGIGSDDAPMKALKRGYAIQKTKKGLGNRRNLTYTGDMLRNISVRSVSARQVRIDITSTKQRQKARANEQKSPWWGWSARDMAQITKAIEQLFGVNIANIGVGFGGGRKARPIWMDPSAFHATSGRLAA
jgi:hypothetical protein